MCFFSCECPFKCTRILLAARHRPDSLAELQRSPRSLNAFKGEGRQKYLCPRAPNTLAPPLLTMTHYTQYTLRCIRYERISDKLDSCTRNKLLKVYCSSLCGCELWDLDNKSLSDLYVAWRKGLRIV